MPLLSQSRHKLASHWRIAAGSALLFLDHR